MINDIISLLSGKDAEDDIKRYSRLVALFTLGIVANSARCSVVIPSDNEPMPMNIYAIGLAGSGLSKTKSLGYARGWLKDGWEEIRIKGNEALEHKDPFNLEEIGDLTKDGVSVEDTYKSMTDSSLMALMRVLDIVGYGSVNYIIDEFASTIGREYEMLSGTILEVYDRGNVSVNLRRTTKTKKSTTPIPLNMLAFGSPHLLFESDDNIEKMFMDLLQAGLARRSIFVNVKTTVNSYQLDSVANEALIRSIKQKLVEIVEKYDHRDLMLSSSAIELLNEYIEENINDSLHLSEFNAIEKIYARNKNWIALKISGLIAVSNMHNEVTREDVEFAIKILDDSHIDLVDILNRPEKYEILVNYLADKGTVENEYTLTKALPFYKNIKSKRQFLELAKGYAYNSNITLQIYDKQNITFYSAKGKVKTDLDKPLMFSYSEDITEGFYTNDDIAWKDFYKVVTKDGIQYSAHSFKDNYRKNDNAIEGFQLVILDIDGGVPLDTAKILFEDYTYLISTTRNHLKEKNGKVEDRYRIILPMEYSLSLDALTYSKMMKNLFEDLPIEVDNLSDIGRFFFGASGEYWYNEGMLLNCDKYVPFTQEEETYSKQGNALTKKNINGISQYIIRNQHSGRNNALVKLALLLMDKGYSHEDAKEEILRVNKQFDNPLSEQEVRRTIFKTLERREEVESNDKEYYEDIEDPFNAI